jgi:hypothetical protein
MKWIARKNVMVDRVACFWLIQRFLDRDAQFLFVDEKTCSTRPLGKGQLSSTLRHCQRSD